MVDDLEETPVLASRGYVRNKLFYATRVGDGEINSGNFVDGVDGFELRAVLNGLDKGSIKGQGLSHGCDSMDALNEDSRKEL